MNDHPIVAALKKAREQRGWSQSVLAQRLYKSPQSINHFENSPGGRHLLLVEEIAASLGMRLALVPIDEERS